MLMIAIDKPADMAARQITTSRKLGILVGKMDTGGSGKVAALSVILPQCRTATPATSIAAQTMVETDCQQA
jgi:hypothetical protein